MSEKKTRQNKLKYDHVSALIACANKAIVRNKRNHMNNQTSGKCHASETSSISKRKVSFVFRSTKDLQEIPKVISRKRSENQENQLHNDAFHGKTSQPSKT